MDESDENKENISEGTSQLSPQYEVIDVQPTTPKLPRRHSNIVNYHDYFDATPQGLIKF
jgi:hypothetical protein